MSRHLCKFITLKALLPLLLFSGLLILPMCVQAIDIAWHSAAMLTYDIAPNYKRDGTAVFNNGEKAKFTIEGTFEPIDSNGLRASLALGVLRFDDGSTITVQFAGSTNVSAATVSGSGEFVRGTGRFDGITGKVTFTGRTNAMNGTVNELDWVGSYSLAGQ